MNKIDPKWLIVITCFFNWLLGLFLSESVLTYGGIAGLWVLLIWWREEMDREMKREGKKLLIKTWMK
jgi:hypothetical protein